MEYVYKQLRENDIDLFRRLNRMFGKAFEDIPTYQDKQPSDEYLHALLAKPHIIPLVAMDGEEVVGGLVAYVLEKFEQERSEVYIYDLAVDEQHRRKGIATRLINELKTIAKEKGAYIRRSSSTNRWEHEKTFIISTSPSTNLFVISW
jgi:aminoglycoside 3-N-acetyltransferase I